MEKSRRIPSPRRIGFACAAMLLAASGGIGCEGNTPNELGPAWIYLSFFSRDSGLGKGWDVWNYDVTGLPHTRIGAGAPIRLITGLLGPNARYDIKVSNLVLTNPYRKCDNFKDEAFK